jgi:hypothetical protein
MSPQPPRPQPHITLVVRTTAGTWSDARFNRNNKAQKIVDDATEHFGLDPTPPQAYILERASTGESIPLDQKIEDLGLSDGDVVILKAPRPTDG